MEVLNHAVNHGRQGKEEEEGGNGKGKEPGEEGATHCSKDGGFSCSLLLGDDDDAARGAAGVGVCGGGAACDLWQERGGASAARSLCGGVGQVWVA